MRLSFFACVAVVVVAASSWSGLFFDSGTDGDGGDIDLVSLVPLVSVVSVVSVVCLVSLVSFLTRKKAAKGLVAINASTTGKVTF